MAPRESALASVAAGPEFVPLLLESGSEAAVPEAVVLLPEVVLLLGPCPRWSVRQRLLPHWTPLELQESVHLGEAGGGAWV